MRHQKEMRVTLSKMGETKAQARRLADAIKILEGSFIRLQRLHGASEGATRLEVESLLAKTAEVLDERRQKLARALERLRTDGDADDTLQPSTSVLAGKH